MVDGSVDRHGTIDLEAVDQVCQLVLTARRLGCAVQLTEVSDELRTLLDLAGMGELVSDGQSDPDHTESDLP
jgi:ABC-type transporter Mla MlaB component